MSEVARPGVAVDGKGEGRREGTDPPETALLQPGGDEGPVFLPAAASPRLESPRELPDLRREPGGKTGAEKPQSEEEGTVSVLVLEDSRLDRELLERMLRSLAFPVRWEVRDRLADGLERLRQEPRIDMVLCDLSLPDSQGLDTFSQICRNPGRVPVVVLSGRDDEQLALKTVEMGGQDYLVKGRFDAALLGRVIRYGITRAELDRRIEDERSLFKRVIDQLPDTIYVKDLEGNYLLDNIAHALGESSGNGGSASVSERAAPAHNAPGATCRINLAEGGNEERRILCGHPRAGETREWDDERVARTGIPVLNRTEVVEHQGGEKHWYSTTKVPFRDRSGRLLGMIGIGRDITETKLIEAQLLESMEELRRKNLELEEDLEMAREVQLAFFPQQYRTFPRTAPEPAFRFYSRYIPAEALGGDFFHVVQVSDRSVGILICDVMGHGVRAALVTALQRALAEGMADVAGIPSAFLAKMNGALHGILRRLGSPLFSTAFYGVADVETGLLRYANAGHPAPIFLKSSRAFTARSGEGGGGIRGPALGIFEHAVYPERYLKMEQGDRLFLITDGLYEVETPGGGMLDRSWLLPVIERIAGMETETLLDRLLDEVRSVSRTGGFHDDVCVLAVEASKLGSKIEPEPDAHSENAVQGKTVPRSGACIAEHATLT